MSTAPFDPVYFLLVDDLEENLLALEGLLRRDGLRLLKARSGQEALELLLKHEVALAFIDVQMPEMSGFELAELMRGIERTRTVPIIFLTAGSADQQRRFRGYEAGAVDFLQKPVELDVLKSKAGVFFELDRRRQEVARYALSLEEADRRKDEFIATLAHELRNPLAPIRNGLEILRIQPVGTTAESVRDMMDRQLGHMVRLIDDLLDTSRISKGKIELRKQKIELPAIIQSAIETNRPQIEEGAHTLILDIPKEPIWLDADMTRMAQAIGNLLNNAAKYTPKNGHIHLSVSLENSMAVIKIADDGIGIPPEMLSKIFDLFTQVYDSSGYSRGGLGIGLTLVRHLVEMHGGSVQAESRGTGKGSTFIIRVPVTEQQQRAAPIIDTVNALNHTPMRVLIVDDNIASAQTTAWILEMMGHEAVQAYNGRQGLLAAKVIKPDAVLLDIGLPDMTGYDVCSMMRQDPQLKNTLIIAQTGWSQKHTREKAYEAGFDHYLVKPTNPQDFAQLLTNVKGPV